MNAPHHLTLNASIGVGGTLLAVITPEHAAIFAGGATGLWMLWQIGLSIFDRVRNRKISHENKPR